MSNDLTSISYAYPDVPGELRGRIAAALAASGVGTQPGAAQLPTGTFVLGTCLRTEILVAGDEDRLDEVTATLLGDLAGTPGAVTRRHLDAVEHLFRIAAGLESPVRGEAEILTQVRQAIRPVKENGDAGGLFVKLLEAAVAAGRAARELFPVSPHDSLAAVAAQVVGYPERVAVLGSGAMATSVVDALASLPVPPQVTVVARRRGRLVRPGVDEWSFDRAAEAIRVFPAVVSATSAKSRLIPDTELAGLLAGRLTPLTLVDMAMPPDFRPPDGAEAVRYVDIDTLAALAARRGVEDDADEIVAKRAVEAYHRFTGHHRVGPLIEMLTATADDVVDRTVNRFAKRLQHDTDQDVLRQAAHTVARTLLAGPLGYLNRTRRPGDVEAIVEAFELDGDG